MMKVMWNKKKNQRYGIELQEFSKLINRIISTLRTELIDQIFDEFDEDESGTISIDEFNAGLRNESLRDLLKGTVLQCLLFPDARKTALNDLDTSGDGLIDKTEFTQFVDNAIAHADHDFMLKTENGETIVCGNKLEKIRVAKRIQESKDQAAKDQQRENNLNAFQTGKSKFVVAGKTSKQINAEFAEKRADQAKLMKEKERNYRKTLKENVDKKLKKRNKLYASDTGSQNDGGKRVNKDTKKRLLQNNLNKALNM